MNLLKVTQERDQIRREREEQVAALNSQLHVMERSYETILQVRHDYVIIPQIHGLSIGSGVVQNLWQLRLIYHLLGVCVCVCVCSRMCLRRWLAGWRLLAASGRLSLGRWSRAHSKCCSSLDEG